MQKVKILFLSMIMMVVILFGNAMVALADEYLLPESATKYLDRDDILGYTQQWLNYARNEIYARHGRQFQSQELADYFNSTDWYNGTIPAEQFDESILNDYERTNADFLWEVEYENDPEGYKLDEPGYDINALTADDIPGAALTRQKAYAAVYKYLDNELGMDTVYDYHGYFVSSDDQAGQAEENEYVFMLRSYTSAHAYYYVNAYTGDVHVARENPIISVYEEREYIFNALGIETEASMSETPEYELMTEDNTYFTSMWSSTRGEPTGDMNNVSTYAYDYAYEHGVFLLSGSLILCEWNEELQRPGPKFDRDHYLQNKVRGFACDEHTQYIAISGESPVKHFAPDEFVEYAIQCKDTGLGFKIEVKNGIASVIEISS